MPGLAGGQLESAGQQQLPREGTSVPQMRPVAELICLVREACTTTTISGDLYLESTGSGHPSAWKM